MRTTRRSSAQAYIALVVVRSEIVKFEASIQRTARLAKGEVTFLPGLETGDREPLNPGHVSARPGHECERRTWLRSCDRNAGGPAHPFGSATGHLTAEFSERLRLGALAYLQMDRLVHTLDAAACLYCRRCTGAVLR